MDKRLFYANVTLCVIAVTWIGVALYYRNDKITPDCCEDDECKKD